MKRTNSLAATLTLVLLLGGCDNKATQQLEPKLTEANISKPVIFMANQIGFTSTQPKFVVLNDVAANDFTVTNLTSNEPIMQGQLSNPKAWLPAGQELYRNIDLSTLQLQGKFRLSIEGEDASFEFTIDDQVYRPLHDAALKAFYYNRSSTQITSAYTDVYARASGHPDEEVMVHQSAATESRPAGTKILSAKGWYDAGDFGKYVVNSGISTYTLLLSYDQHRTFYQQHSSQIPESNNDVPDILDEIKWNLDWLKTMQDEDGSVYHKLTTLEWPGIEMPEEDTRERYVIGKSTSAALNFAAVMAYASRIYTSESELNSEYSIWLEAAELAWQWAKENPNLVYQQPEDVKSGEYGDDNFSDEFLWAAVELYLATLDPEYLADFNIENVELISPAWQQVSVLPLISLLNYQGSEIDNTLVAKAKSKLIELADEYVQQYRDSVFKVAMVTPDFVWGSNSVALNKALVLAQAYKVSGKEEYKQAAEGGLDYILGQNPLAFSFVTGFGENSVKFPHHRTSAADNIEAPVPGFVAGGPQPGKQDKCDYQFSLPAKTYVDDWCSYASNEVAINWNAPLVYMLAFKLNLE